MLFGLTILIVTYATSVFLSRILPNFSNLAEMPLLFGIFQMVLLANTIIGKRVIKNFLVIKKEIFIF